MTLITSIIHVIPTTPRHNRNDSIPPRSIANNLWIGDPSASMRRLTLPGRLLTNPIRNRIFVLKLKNWADPSTKQRGVKGSCISFPQKNPLAATERDVLPRPLSELPEYLQIIFVGNTKPTEKQLQKMFKVSADDVTDSLAQWRLNEHRGFSGTWNEANLQSIRECKDTTSIIAGCVSFATDDDDRRSKATSTALGDTPDSVEATQDAAATDSTPTDNDDDDYTDDNDVVLESSGILNVDGLGEDRAEGESRAFDALFVPHDKDPTTQFDNPDFWVDAFPVLFPYGCGGAEDKSRPVKLSLAQWIRHKLNYYDGRFQTDPSFIYVCYTVLQTRERLTKTHILYKKLFSKRSTAATNAVTSGQLQVAYSTLKTTKTLYNKGPACNKTLDLLKNASIVGANMTGSVFERAACRPELLALVTNKNLPNLFVTINPNDLENPIVSFWNGIVNGGTDEPAMKFNLDTLIGDFPKKPDRAKIVGNNPVLPAIFFDTVMNAFLESFLGYEIDSESPTTSLKKGKLLNDTIFTGLNSRGLKAFYGTVECQGRGSLHLHLLIWLSGIPTPTGMCSTAHATFTNITNTTITPAII
jgi:hypothetical protein